MDFDLRRHTELLTLSGSRAYGLHTEASDVDLRGVAIPPVRRVLSMHAPFEQADQADEIAVFHDDLTAEEQAIASRTKLEGSVYALRKLARLASDCNPNILDVLYCRDAEVRRCTPIGEALRASRSLFLSARARHSYAGYATAQLKRIRTHRSWLLDPPERPPSREDFGLPEMPVIPGQQLAAAEAAVRKQIDRWEIDFASLPGSRIVALKEEIARVLAEKEIGADETFASAARHVGLGENFIEHMQQERQYANAHRRWKQFKRWERSRNPERAALEARHGYDTKHAAHLVRLLRMGFEVLTTGEVHVWRGDRDREELLAVRAGAWSYERLIEETDGERARLEALPEERVVVPAQADVDAIDALVIDLLGRRLGLSPTPP